MGDMRTVHLMSGESLQNRALEHLEMDAQASIGTRASEMPMSL